MWTNGGLQRSRGCIREAFWLRVKRLLCFCPLLENISPIGVVLAWYGCYHAAGETGGTLALPSSQNLQAEGKKSGTGERGDRGTLRREKMEERKEKGERGQCLTHSHQLTLIKTPFSLSNMSC